MTFAKTKAALITTFNTLKETVAKLSDRWNDEKEFEDFAEYEKVLKQLVIQKGGELVTFVRTSKRPFGVVVRVQGVPGDWLIYSKPRSNGIRRA